MLTMIKKLLDKVHPRFHLPLAVAGALGIALGAFLTALHMNPDLASALGQAFGLWLGAGG